jgi:diguanylate cyclase (GGDEF)-like protein
MSLSMPSLLPDDTRNLGVRGLIACVASFIAFFGFWLVHALAMAKPEMGAFYAPLPLQVMQHCLELAMVCALALALVSWRIRSSGEEPVWLTAAITVTMSLNYTLLGLAYGFYTTPMGFVIMGVLAFGLIFFDRRAVLAGMAVSVLLFVVNEVLMAQGLLDYAPLLSRSPFAGEGTELAWWWGIHLRVIFIVAFCAFFALLLFQVEQLERQRHALHELAVTDPLTKVSNRRRFGERLDEEVQRRTRSGRPFCVMLCDADHFKKVNDTYGHHTGDVVLQHLAGVLAAGVRANIDVVGRLGGEEFGVLLPETALVEALDIAERIGTQMREHEFVAGSATFRVTISIGLVESLEGSGEDALRVADANLYRAKGDGRDRVVGSVGH